MCVQGRIPDPVFQGTAFSIVDFGLRIVDWGLWIVDWGVSLVKESVT